MSLSFPDATTPFWIREPTTNSSLPGEGQLVLQKNETEIVYAAPIPNRCWCDLNNGRLLWPVLSGYRYLDGKISDKRVKEDLRQWRERRDAALGLPSRTQDTEADLTPEAPVEPSSTTTSFQAEETRAPSWWRRLAFKQTTPTASVRPSGTDAYDPLVPEDPYHEDPLMNWDGVSAIPTGGAPILGEPTHTTSLLSPSAASWWSSFVRSRYDLRLHGIGMVVDFGLTRTEEHVKEEIMQMLDWKARQRPDEVLEEVEEETAEAGMVDATLSETSECFAVAIAVADADPTITRSSADRTRRAERITGCCRTKPISEGRRQEKQTVVPLAVVVSRPADTGENDDSTARSR